MLITIFTSLQSHELFLTSRSFWIIDASNVQPRSGLLDGGSVANVHKKKTSYCKNVKSVLNSNNIEMVYIALADTIVLLCGHT